MALLPQNGRSGQIECRLDTIHHELYRKGGENNAALAKCTAKGQAGGLIAN
jgi:hypothetical protein